MSSLYDRPDLYDLASPRDPEMEKFYLETAHFVGPRALELACGTGRLAIPLALSGIELVGGNLSRAMLGAARQAAKEEGAVVDVVELDMRARRSAKSFLPSWEPCCEPTGSRSCSATGISIGGHSARTPGARSASLPHFDARAALGTEVAERSAPSNV